MAVKSHFKIHWNTRLLASAACFAMLAGSLPAQQTSPVVSPEVSALIEKYNSACASLAEGQNKEKDVLILDYVNKLTALEAKYKASGNLDGLLSVKEEREKVTAEGVVTTKSDPELDRLRATFTGKSGEVQRRKDEKAKQFATTYLSQLTAMETAFTKAGKLDSAIAARDARLKVQAKISPQASQSDESAGQSQAVADFPTDTPPLATGNPFKEDKITQSLTVPPGKYRLKDKVEIACVKGAKGSTVVIPKGTEISAADKGGIFIYSEKIIGRDASFTSVPFDADLHAGGYFSGCTFKDCTFRKGGKWNGPSYASKWWFQNCKIQGSLLKQFRVEDIGLRLLNCTISGADLNGIDFGKIKVSEARANRWMQVRGTRFEKCKVSVSFLLITEGCTFSGCTFVDDDANTELDQPIKVTLYEQGSVWKTKALPQDMTVEKLPAAR